jgi:hypothetical protein
LKRHHLGRLNGDPCHALGLVGILCGIHHLLGRDLLEQLEAIGNELMANAVELDTQRDRNYNAGKPSSS